MADPTAPPPGFGSLTYMDICEAVRSMLRANDVLVDADDDIQVVTDDTDEDDRGEYVNVQHLATALVTRLLQIQADPGRLIEASADLEEELIAAEIFLKPPTGIQTVTDA